MSTQQAHVLVIGGGAAGIFAAIHAAQNHPHWTVHILESAPKPLGKVKISGGGRCNVTTAITDIPTLIGHYPRGEKALYSVFNHFGPQDTQAWFTERGVALKTEADGRIFPVSDQSQSIIDCLLEETKRLGIRIHCQTPALAITQADSGFLVNTSQGAWQAQCVVVSVGSATKLYPSLQALGHHLIPGVPSLFTFQIAHPLLSDLAGISFPHITGKLITAHAKKPIIQSGPLLITHWGLSGPLVLRLSAWGARALFDSRYQAELCLDFLPALTINQAETLLLVAKTDHSKKQMVSFCPFEHLPKRFWGRFLDIYPIAPETRWGDVKNQTLTQLASQLKHYILPVQGKGPFKEEFVTAGGIPLTEIDMKTMQSKCCPGLFFAGEVIDVDGLTGGFNFQNAWSTGFIAGTACVTARQQNAIGLT